MPLWPTPFTRRGTRFNPPLGRPDSLVSLVQEGISTLLVDVNDVNAIGAATAAVEEAEGRLDIPVNNAGFSRLGAVLDLDRDDLQGQYEINVIPLAVVLQKALPLVRQAVRRDGRTLVVNVGSLVGLFTSPLENRVPRT